VPKIPELIAHRGYAERYPENTLPAFIAAIEVGARFVECDIQLSADQVPVLFHDVNLERLCNQTGAIHDYPLHDLGQFRAANAGRFGKAFADITIPTLDEFLALLKMHPKVTAFVEMKILSLRTFGHEKVVGKVLEKLKGLDRQVVIISYDTKVLYEVRRHGWTRIGVVIDRWHESGRPEITELRPQFLFCDIRGLPINGDVTFAGAQIAVFEVAEPLLALQLAARGVDLVETFAVKEMLDALTPSTGRI